MRRTIGKLLVAGVGALLAACMSITVNVYFPEKDVKQAYKSLDEMLLKHGEGKGAEPAGGGEEKPAEPPAGEKPQSSLKGGQFSFAFITEAQAAENVADTLAIEISSLPEALKAYEEMKARQPQLNDLRDQGIVGETYQGLVTVRDAKRIGDKQPLVKAENDNRKTVITAMAKAILRINKQPETRGNMNQVFPKAAATFAETRREEARPGWWIEVVKGRWVQK